MKTLHLFALLGILFVVGCAAPDESSPDIRNEADVHAEVPPGGDYTNRANGPVGSGGF